MADPNYERGRQDGATETWIEDLREDVHEIKQMVRRLTSPDGLCARRGAAVASHAAAIRLLQWLCGMLITVDVALVAGLLYVALGV